MAQWLRALDALAEDQDSILSTHSMAQKHLTLFLGDLMPSSGLHGHIYIYAGNILIHIKSNNPKVFVCGGTHLRQMNEGS